ncbi:MAG TPA: hypothetical protein VFE45_16740 [Coriobacteriia bacterium]|nr:hypothetical protein [Coriobacteriia bacterium]
MDALTLDDLKSLTSITGPALVSIYLPTVPFGPSSQVENTGRLKGLLKTAEEKLHDLGLRGPQIDSILEPARRLSEDRPFWLRATEGLAVLLGDTIHTYRLPAAPSELVVVGSRFHIKPLLALMGARQHAYLLALSQKRVRLFRMTQAGIDEVDLAGAPANLAEALQWDNFEKRSLQFHTGTSGAPGGGRRPAVFHGSGEPDPKDEITRYFRDIDKALGELVADDCAPLVLAAVDYLVPLYREVSSIGCLASETVTGNPDSLGDAALHEHAWRIAEGVFDKERRAVADRIDDLWATPKTTADPETLVTSALQGRVDTLFVALDRQVWGTVGENDEVAIHAGPAPGNEDLLDLAALETLLAGGTTYALPAEQMPRDVPAVALLRY